MSNDVIKPSFFIVGAPKCGTTSFSEYLRSNPSVFISDPKELHFFCDDLNVPGAVSSKSDYLSHFDRAGSQHKAIGEASPLYLLSETAAKNLYDFCPDSKIIVMLRSTPEYLHSYYSHLLYLGDENISNFENAWNAQFERKSGKLKYPIGCREPKRLDYRWAGMLGEHVQRLLSVFPREQVKFILLEDMKQNPRKIYLEVLEFIGANDDGRSVFPAVNVNKRHRIGAIGRVPHYVPSWLVTSVSKLKQLSGLQGISFTQFVLKINSSTGSKKKLPDPMRCKLIEEFHDDIQLLSRLIGRNLDHWLKNDVSS